MRHLSKALLAITLAAAVWYILQLRGEVKRARDAVAGAGLYYVATTDSNLAVGLHAARLFGGGTIFVREGKYQWLGPIPYGTRVIGYGQLSTRIGGVSFERGARNIRVRQIDRYIGLPEETP